MFTGKSVQLNEVAMHVCAHCYFNIHPVANIYICTHLYIPQALFCNKNIYIYAHNLKSVSVVVE